MTLEHRTGIGYDLHRLKEGDGFHMGGIFIKAPFSVVAHSDGDILIHSLCDAILGALGMGDIGQHFPPSDNKWKNVSGKTLLSEVIRLTAKRLESIVNIDCVIKMEKPRLLPYQTKIRDSIAQLLSINNDRVNIKIKSGEGVGVVGRSEAAEAYVVISLRARI